MRINILLNIILLISISCNGQSRIDELIAERDSIEDLLHKEINYLLTANTKLHFQKDSFLFIIDSLELVIENLESQPVSDSLVIFKDNFYLYVRDSINNILEAKKQGSNIWTNLINEEKRIDANFVDGERKTIYMNDNLSIGSMIEDSTGIISKLNYK